MVERCYISFNRHIGIHCWVLQVEIRTSIYSWLYTRYMNMTKNSQEENTTFYIKIVFLQDVQYGVHLSFCLFLNLTF